MLSTASSISQPKPHPQPPVVALPQTAVPSLHPLTNHLIPKPRPVSISQSLPGSLTCSTSHSSSSRLSLNDTVSSVKGFSPYPNVYSLPAPVGSMRQTSPNPVVSGSSPPAHWGATTMESYLPMTSRFSTSPTSVDQEGPLNLSKPKAEVSD